MWANENAVSTHVNAEKERIGSLLWLMCIHDDDVHRTNIQMVKIVELI